MQVKVNKTAITCPSVNRRQRLRSAKSRWVADAIKNWVQESQMLVLHNSEEKVWPGHTIYEGVLWKANGPRQYIW